MRALIAAFLLLSLTGCLHGLDEKTMKGRYHPIDPGAKEVHFLAFGDMGTGSAKQYRVARAMHDVCEREGCHFALGLGDNFYPGGVESVDDPQFKEKFEDPYAIFGDFDIWMILGNHDWKKGLKGAQRQIDYTQKSDRWLMPQAYYPVPGLPAWLNIYGIDTWAVEAVIGTGHLEYAKQYLCDRPGWRFLFGHYPLRSSNRNANAWVRSSVETLIRECGVQVYFAGHDHDQEHLDQGYYQQIIQGAAGAHGVSKLKFGTPRQKFATLEFGFAWVRVTPDQLEIRFYDWDARVLYTWMTTFKEQNARRVNASHLDPS